MIGGLYEQAWEYQGHFLHGITGLGLMVPCFYCGATVGVGCQTKSGKPVPWNETHDLRRKFLFAEGWYPLPSGVVKLMEMGLIPMDEEAMDELCLWLQEWHRLKGGSR